VLNSPLSYTDSSGYFFKASGKLWIPIVAGAAAGYVSSGSLKGALIGALSGAVFHGIGDYFQGLQHSNGLAAVSGSGVGSIQGLGEAYAAGASITSAQAIGKVIAHGATGGVMSTLQGGKFAHGFASAGITQAFAKHINNIGGGSRSIGAVAGRVSAAALVGGTASELSGGKFVNGAVTGAFSRAFNEEKHFWSKNVEKILASYEQRRTTINDLLAERILQLYAEYPGLPKNIKFIADPRQCLDDYFIGSEVQIGRCEGNSTVRVSMNSNNSMGSQLGNMLHEVLHADEAIVTGNDTFTNYIIYSIIMYPNTLHSTVPDKLGVQWTSFGIVMLKKIIRS